MKLIITKLDKGPIRNFEKMKLIKNNNSIPKSIQQVKLRNVSFNYNEQDSFYIKKINLTLKKYNHWY